MKKLFSIIILLVAFTGCKPDITPELSKVVSGEFDPLPLTEFVLTEPTDGSNPLVITLTWSKALFYLDGKEFPVGNVRYLVEADIAGNNFANAVTFAASDAGNPLAANLFVNDINTILVDNFKAMAGQPIKLDLRIKTEYGEDGDKNYVWSMQPLNISFAAFRSENELIPHYLIGDMTDWDLNAKTFLMYREDNKADNHIHTYTGKFGANTRFKFCAELALGDTGKMWGKGEGNNESGSIVYGGEDFVIATEGYYTLTINDKARTYKIIPYDASAKPEYAILNFVGQFCNWGTGGAGFVSEPEMQNFVVKTSAGSTITDPHNWYLEVQLDVIDYGVKFRANHSWDPRWCPLKSSDQPYGVAEFNPPSNRDPNIDIATQGIGKYEVRFNDLTCHYFVKKVN